ncbi:MAG: hypothetical protein JWO67_22 [Streptosporangiaceae bacterium]|nr:hypothetical protein [Streptosporangiaceae bacterium]
MALLTPIAPPTTQTGVAAGDAHNAPAQIVNPFTKAAREHVEQIIDVSWTPAGAVKQLGNGTIEVPAYGYLRHLLLLVEATGGAGGNAAINADAPWNVLTDVGVTDVNGQWIFGPYSGYETMLAHLLGGYSFDSDPTRSPAYSAPDASGNFSYLLRIPFEITSQDGLGALANQNAASTFKVKASMNQASAVFSTSPTTMPSVRLRIFMETWTQPNSTDTLGVPNQVQPPSLGTVQNWTKEDKNIAVGSQNPRISRVGNAIRNLVLVTRDVSGNRISTMLPDPLQLNWDGRQLFQEPTKLIRHYMQERYGYAAAALPLGVYALDFTHDFDGHPGGELRNGYLPTTQASRIELTGQWGAAGTLTIMTNDVLAFADAAL